MKLPDGAHLCELCCGRIVIEDGVVYHTIERHIVGENPHDGWWKEHPLGPRYLCDGCYAETFHPQFDYGAPPYIPRSSALMDRDLRMRREMS